jgi:membrane complex biogenesis BtpA family protein
MSNAPTPTISWPRPMLFGMVHLPPLPGSPRHGMSMDGIVAHAVQDALTLRDAGFPAVIVENFGDAPFKAGSLEPVTIAAMAVVVREVVHQVGLVTGVNCLRNDPLAALGVAAAAGASFVRVNVHIGVAATDQGTIVGDAYSTVRERERLGGGIGILADVHVKHAVPLSQPDIGQAAEETAYRGLADALIVSGAGTGKPAALDDLRRVKAAAPDRPLLVGSGATPETTRELLSVADGLIVGTCLKKNGDASEPIDTDLAARFMSAVRG